MIYIIDNGQRYSDHRLYFVKAPKDFGNWFTRNLLPWYQARSMESGAMTIVASAPTIEWRDEDATLDYETFLGGDDYLCEYDYDASPPEHRPLYKGV